MKQLALTFFTISFLVIFILACGEKQASLRKEPVALQNITGNEVSRLQNGVIVRFPATLGKLSENNCIEVFAPEEYTEYSGDPKWAIPSRLARELPFADQLQPGTNVIVTGHMNFIRDSSVPTETCNILTGQLFEVTDVEYR